MRGAAISALLLIAGVPTAEAANCKCASSYRNDGRAYAQSWYDYRSSSRVTESFGYDDGFRPAPDDARLPPPPAYYPPPPVEGSYDNDNFSGGVGYGAPDAGYAYGYGYGYAVHYANGDNRNLPSNGGGVNLPPGYGPTYRGVWQGARVPTRGGLGVKVR
jgi:hypothetical protein